jgi:uncharacterized protein YbjT (DUF2867 family)
MSRTSARICVEAADGPDIVLDAAGPETITFDELVQGVRRALGRRGP